MLNEDQVYVVCSHITHDHHCPSLCSPVQDGRCKHQLRGQPWNRRDSSKAHALPTEPWSLSQEQQEHLSSHGQYHGTCAMRTLSARNRPYTPTRLLGQETCSRGSPDDSTAELGGGKRNPRNSVEFDARNIIQCPS